MNSVAFIRVSPVARLMASLLLGVAVGCGGGDAKRLAVSGRVTFDGQPIDQGQIIFSPTREGFTAVGAIAGGAYTIESQKGPSPGAYVVRITAERPTGQKAKPGGYAAGQPAQDVYEQFIPPKYNDSSELAIELKDRSQVVHDFELKSQ
jgi:hypothetical protein